MKDEIILDNLGLIHKAIKDLHCVYRNKEEFDTFYYAGLIGLINASKTYDKTKGKSGYLYRSIKFRIKNVFGYNSNPKRHNGKAPISLNTEVYETQLQDLIISDYNLEKEVINKMYVEYLLGKLKNKRYKKFIIEYYGIGVPELKMQEIADKYGVSRQYVHQCIHRGLDLIKERIVEEK